MLFFAVIFLVHLADYNVASIMQAQTLAVTAKGQVAYTASGSFSHVHCADHLYVVLRKSSGR